MKQIPIQLQSHLRQHATTWCYLMRIACVGKWAGIVRGFTSVDHPLEYDDGQGPVLYRSDGGFMPAKFQQEAAFTVDNTEVTGWVVDDGITETDILAGIFDAAEVTIYRVNYMDLAAGHEVVAFGTLGQTVFNENTWRCEFRSLTQMAKQPYGQVYSLTCRNQYGDEKCKMPFVWHEAEVTGVGENAMLVIEASTLTQPEGFFAPGVIEVLSGANAGADMDVDAFFSGGVIRLALQLPMPFTVGDTFRIRVDCDKRFETCKMKGNILEFRGEHLTPVADTSLAVPGAYVRRRGGGGGGGDIGDGGGGSEQQQ